MASRFDVIIVGAGPAGYVAAIRCAQLGLKTACVDDWINQDGKPSLGGTCLNVGCIPSKVLLESSELYDHISSKQMAEHGIKLSAPTLDLKAMMLRKDKVVNDLTQGIMGLFKANQISWIHGRGTLLPNQRVAVSDSGNDDNEAVIYEADHVILATGSSPVEIPAAPLIDNMIVDSTGALSFSEVPKTIGVIGAGAIGLELGSVWRRLGSKVVMLEALETFLTVADEQISKEAFRQFTAQGLDIRLGARVMSCAIKRNKVEVEYQDMDGKHLEKFDKLIVSVGRRPNTNGLSAAETGLLLDEWGFVHVDSQCRSNLPGVYAIGDMVRGPMLAHKGSEEGIMVAEIIAGHHSEVNYEIIPAVIYTEPEIAWVGKNEQTLRAAGENYKAGSFPFAASGRARALGNVTGMIKVIADEASDRVLGVHMIGPHCSELIGQAVMAMSLGASSEDIAMTIFAHPTLSESFHEAALAVDGRSIHVAQRKRKK